MYPETIFTLDARENVFLESIKASSNLSTQEIHKEIRGLFENLIDTLRVKNVNYEHLKNALVPSTDKNEIALAFDTSQIGSTAYGSEVFSKILPLFEQDNTFSCLCGDYIGNNENQIFLRDIFFEEINPINTTIYKYRAQFFIVYFNNLSYRQLAILIKGLAHYKPFTGYFNLTYSSLLKTVLSTQLIRLFVKHKKTILLSSEENEDGNSTMYPLEENGYKCLGIDALFYGIFLSYKIEREVFSGFETDITFSLNAITQNVLDIKDFKLVIEDKKLQYLHTNKIENLERANLHILNKNELAEIIRKKMQYNYLYNLSYLANYKTIKFNIIVEVPRVDKKLPMKLIAALQYIETNKELRLITMF